MEKKSWIPLLALAACMSSAHAGWQIVAPLEANNGKSSLYMNDQDVEKDGQRVRVWTLYDLPPGQLSVREKEVRSIRDRIEIDCGRATYTSTSSHYSDGAMGAGKEILTLGASPEEEVMPGTALASVAKQVCPAR